MRDAPTRVAILVNNTYVADARAWKTAVSLGRAGYDVTVIARWGPGLATTEQLDQHAVTRVRQPQPLAWLPVPGLPETDAADAGPWGGLRRRLRESIGRAAQALRYLRLSRAWAEEIADQVDAADVWQAESVITLGLAVALRKRLGGLVVYDANDIDSESGRMARLPGPWRQLLRRHERRLARAADAVVTVSDPYAQVLARILGRPVDAVVRNAAVVDESDAEPTADDVRRSDRFTEALGQPPDRRIVLYMGQVMEGRGLRQLFEAILLVDGADLVVAGFGPDFERYQAIAAALPHAARIHFMGSVSPADIPDWTRGADVSAMPVQPDTLNHRLNTPTKLYDAMGVGVPVVASRLPGIAPIVRETGCGVLCDPTDPVDIARAIREIIDAPEAERVELRLRCLAAARTRYSWQVQAQELLRVYGRLGSSARVRVLFLPDYREANAYQRALADGLAELGVDVRADPTRRRRVLPVTEAMRRHGRPDIVHVHWTEPYIAAGRSVSRVKVERTLLELRAARRAGSRIVWTAHDLYRHDRSPDPRERGFMRRLFDLTSAVIVHCDSAVDGLVAALALGAAERARVHVIPHGHYVGRYPDTVSKSEARSRLGLPVDSRVVAFVGWVRAYKGVSELVEAFGRVDGPSLRLVIAGRAVDDDYAAGLRESAAADGRVRLELGFVPDEELQVYLRAADVVAAPFLEIFTSGSVLLAMSFGRAVIAPRRGCVADTLDEAGGLLYDADDPSGLEGALRAALTADLDAMGRHNTTSLERFAWPRIAAATRDVYEGVVRGG